MRLLASFAVLALVAAAIVNLAGQGTDPRLTVSDVENVTGLKGLWVVAPDTVTGAGPGLNFAGPDRKMVLMVNFCTADLYRRAKD